MKQITITEDITNLDHVFALAEEGPVVIIAPNGKQYVLAPADDFDQEVAQLRQNASFQQFLNERSGKHRPRRPLADVAREIEAEIAGQENSH